MEDLFTSEGYYIKNNKSVNKYIPGRTLQQYKIDLREELNERQNKYALEIKEKFKKKE